MATKSTTSRKTSAPSSQAGKRSATKIKPEKEISDHRARQGCITELLNEFFGPFDKAHPSVWDQRACQLLVGIIYDRLTCHEKEMPTDELAVLAKLLAEQRRAGVRCAGPKDAHSKEDGDGTAQLENQLDDAVRQLYGTSLHVEPADHGQGGAQIIENGVP